AMPLLPFLTGDARVASLEDWLAACGGEGLARARRLGPEQTIKEVSLSRLRGRGGAGFPTGTKWASVREAAGSRRYAVCNAAEGEPATFKDRALLRANPWQVVEGLAVAALAVGADEAYLAVKARFEREHAALVGAVAAMEGAGLLGDLAVTVVAGPDEYLFGEEKALLEVIEGHDPLPRLLPPFQHGLFATGPQLGWEAHPPASPPAAGPEPNPTLVNNVETLANVPHILARGPEWFRRMGTDRSPGTIVCTAVGDVGRPGVYEVEMGTPMAELLELAGGPLPGRSFKAAFSGVGNRVIPARNLATPLTYEDMQAAGSGLGAAGFAVYDDTACMVDVAAVLSRFLWVESCGQCPPCKRGSGDITEALERLRAGRGGDADVGMIGARLRTVTDANRCYLGTEEQLLVSSILETFPEDFADHLAGFCRLPPREHVVPKVDDVVDGTVVYDRRHARKNPDWTYGE
ncbi:MAG TPA: NADH-ubiquinone oxidoreductase-F iron-sulfur binding region domain-containing protein, partial [Acidimicrobiales bacterium]|nr:NADH-ubiquinone oxidoreductase-F iron-sulfur binding region domain-containing protein [Acidimicrobiales bacterium]